MYRIHFHAKTGKFVIQIMWLGTFWRNAKGMIYDTYADALAAVADVGLNNLYQDKSENARKDFLKRVEQHDSRVYVAPVQNQPMQQVPYWGGNFQQQNGPIPA